MDNISQHFSRSEFACRCGCGFATADIELVQVLENIRAHFGEPVIINSGCRCEQHNRDVGGRPGSKHLQGIAADIVVRGIVPGLVVKYLNNKYPDKYGIGEYRSFTHIDIRADKARWRGY